MVHPKVSINHSYPIHPIILQKAATNLIIFEALKNKAHGWTSAKTQGEKWMDFSCHTCPGVCSIINMVILRRNYRNVYECPSMCRYTLPWLHFILTNCNPLCHTWLKLPATFTASFSNVNLLVFCFCFLPHCARWLYLKWQTNKYMAQFNYDEYLKASLVSVKNKRISNFHKVSFSRY